MKQEPVTKIMADAVQEMVHWCSRVRDLEDEDKLEDYQPYYAGDLTQK